MCVWNPEKFRDPAVRELWKKGHKFKLPMADETLHAEIAEGLKGYIDYMRRKHEIPGDAFAAWFGAITRRVQEELALQPGELKPQGGYGMDAGKRVHKDLAVVKEDRGPHNIVAMCMKTYFGARHQYMEAQGTFEDAQENGTWRGGSHPTTGCATYMVYASQQSVAYGGSMGYSKQWRKRRKCAQQRKQENPRDPQRSQQGQWLEQGTNWWVFCLQ